MTPATRRPSWLYDGPLTDRARLEHCPRCRTLVLRALAGDKIDTSVELHALTPTEELAAQLAGRFVAGAVVRAGAVHLDFRYAEQIRAGRGLPVAHHDCRSWPPWTGPSDRRLLPIRPDRPADNEEPTW